MPIPGSVVILLWCICVRLCVLLERACFFFSFLFICLVCNLFLGKAVRRVENQDYSVIIIEIHNDYLVSIWLIDAAENCTHKYMYMYVHVHIHYCYILLCS